MTTPAETVIAAMQAAVPDGAAISFAELRKACAPITAHQLSNVLRGLRHAGKIEWDQIALAPSLQVAAAVAVAVQDDGGIAEAVKAEALASAEARASARSISSVLRASTISAASARRAATIGADFQAMAVESPQDAALILKRRWSAVWARLCAEARASGDRPVPHMVAVLERAMGVEG